MVSEDIGLVLHWALVINTVWECRIFMHYIKLKCHDWNCMVCMRNRQNTDLATLWKLAQVLKRVGGNQLFPYHWR